MLLARGLPSDCDSWAQWGLAGLSFRDFLPAFKRIEAHEDGATDWRGGRGPPPVTRPPQDNPLFDAFIEAGHAPGHPVTQDFNGPEPEGFGRTEFTIRDGRRSSAARARLDPARTRPNLRVVTHKLLPRVVFENVYRMRPESRGTLALCSADPCEPPLMRACACATSRGCAWLMHRQCRWSPAPTLRRRR